MRSVCIAVLFAGSALFGGVQDHVGVEQQIQERFSETHGTISVGGQQIGYTATAGNLILQDEKGRDRGTVFFVAYHRDPAPKGVRRPVMFCTNGGPGSSATWLHLGLLGPKRIVCDDKGVPITPFQLVNNDESLLDVTDLVFVDPISTGFSRAAPGEDEKQFHGVDEDAKWMGEFIRLYLSQFGGWDGPLYFIGESYGSTRAAALATSLIDRQRIYLERIVLISSALNFQTFEFGSGNDLPYIMVLPSYAAAAWYHRKLPESLQKKTLDEVIAEAEVFAVRDYNIALMEGDRLSAEEKDKVASQLALYTGLEKSFLLRSDLRVPTGRFRQELLGAESKIVGRFDCRYRGQAENPVGCQATYYPSFDALFGPFNAAINDYLHRDLKWDRRRTMNYWLAYGLGSIATRITTTLISAIL